MFLISLSTAALLTCSSDTMKIVLSKSYLASLGYDGTHLQLNDPSCHPVVTDSVTFSFPLASCGTTKKVKQGEKSSVNKLTMAYLRFHNYE